MGTTLTNGVYLPNEGERNCYAGLKTNWEILDQKVADVTALQQAVAGALHREIVESLPTTDIDPNTIYMILSGTSATENVYNEFMYVNNAWELIGTSATDLTNYYTKSEVDGKLLLKASASDLTSHTGDTTIHVTASDKTKWTNSANTVVLRLAKTALTPSSSTNAFSNLDDATALKVGDKVMDTAGVLFEVTAIDTANSTFTIGTSLIDLAQDSDVVHKSGNEDINGIKTFKDKLNIFNAIRGVDLTSQTVDADTLTSNAGGDIKLYRCISISGASNITNIPVQTAFILIVIQIKYTGVADSKTLQIFYDIASSSVVNVYTRIHYNGTWSNWVKDTDKFVTTDTNQTISGSKTLESILVYNSDTTAYASYLNLKNQKNVRGSTTDTGVQGIQYQDKNGKTLTMLESRVINDGNTGFNIICYNTDLNNQSVSGGVSVIKTPTATNFTPNADNAVTCGRALAKWSDVQTYRVNALEPSALGMPNIDNRVDISSYITDLTGVNNEYTPTVNGWICVRSPNATKISILDSATSIGNQSVSSTATYLTVMTPVVANRKVYLNVVCTSLSHAYFIPCQGNV